MRPSPSPLLPQRLRGGGGSGSSRRATHMRVHACVAAHTRARECVAACALRVCTRVVWCVRARVGARVPWEQLPFLRHRLVSLSDDDPAAEGSFLGVAPGPDFLQLPMWPRRRQEGGVARTAQASRTGLWGRWSLPCRGHWRASGIQAEVPGSGAGWAGKAGRPRPRSPRKGRFLRALAPLCWQLRVGGRAAACSHPRLHPHLSLPGRRPGKCAAGYCPGQAFRRKLGGFVLALLASSARPLLRDG